MKYYHGTDKYFKNFEFPSQKLYRDFGYGIYISESEIHARKVAYWKRGVHAYVYTYQVNITEIRKYFNVKEFKTASIEWLKYIIENRTKFLQTNYDMVIGPTADAKAQDIIQSFISKNKEPSLENYKELQKDLKTSVYGTQICIKSQGLLNLFNQSRVKEIKLK